MPEKKRISEIKESEWLEELREIRSEVGIPGYWETLEENCAQWSKDITVCPFWTEANEHLSHWISEYRLQERGNLLLQPGLPNFEGKEIKRTLNKLYEKRCENENFKNEVFLKDGPPIPKLNDLVRTRIACLYVDGVEFLANKLYELAKVNNLNPKHSREGRVEGYFAQHINFTENVLYRFGGGSEQGVIRCEIQIATEMSTRIWDSTHKIYEISRETLDNPEEWQWNPKDPRFVSRQLGHMIHLADGLLVQLRDTATLEKTERSKK